jgi:hypothetical protein
MIGLFTATEAGDAYSIGLALQQIAPYLRNGDPLPARLTVPMICGASSEARKREDSDDGRSGDGVAGERAADVPGGDVRGSRRLPGLFGTDKTNG